MVRPLAVCSVAFRCQDQKLDNFVVFWGSLATLIGRSLVTQYIRPFFVEDSTLSYCELGLVRPSIAWKCKGQVRASPSSQLFSTRHCVWPQAGRNDYRPFSHLTLPAIRTFGSEQEDASNSEYLEKNVILLFLRDGRRLDSQQRRWRHRG